MGRSTDQGRVGALPIDHAGALKAFNEPIASQVENERTIVAACRRDVGSAREPVSQALARLVGQPATDLDALTALAGGEAPDFARVGSE
jgi:hypothetical protein